MTRFLRRLLGIPNRDDLSAMSMVDLIAQINYDAADGRIITPYSREYDKRSNRK